MRLLGISMIELYAHLLLSLLVLVPVLAAVIVAMITAVNLLLRRTKRRAAERQAHSIKFRPDGEPYPPASRGMCDSCEQAYEKVYNMPSGKRLCPDCYVSEEMRQPRAEVGGSLYQNGDPERSEKEST